METLKRKSWFRRHWIVTGILGFLVLLWIISAITEVEKSKREVKKARIREEKAKVEEEEFKKKVDLRIEESRRKDQERLEQRIRERGGLPHFNAIRNVIMQRNMMKTGLVYQWYCTPDNDTFVTISRSSKSQNIMEVLNIWPNVTYLGNYDLKTNLLDDGSGRPKEIKKIGLTEMEAYQLASKFLQELKNCDKVNRIVVVDGKFRDKYDLK